MAAATTTRTSSRCRARASTPDAADAIVATFLATDFDGGRHARRVDQIAALETTATATETPA